MVRGASLVAPDTFFTETCPLVVKLERLQLVAASFSLLLCFVQLAIQMIWIGVTPQPLRLVNLVWLRCDVSFSTKPDEQMFYAEVGRGNGRHSQAMRTVALRLLEVPRWLQATQRHQKSSGPWKSSTCWRDTLIITSRTFSPETPAGHTNLCQYSEIQFLKSTTKPLNRLQVSGWSHLQATAGTG